MQPENQRERRDAPYGAIGNRGAELVGRRWYVNLRSSDHTFDARPFGDSVLVREATPTYITVQVDDDRVAVIPWSAIAFLGNSPSIGAHAEPQNRT